MADDTELLDTASTLDSLSLKTRELSTGANSFARAMTSAFATSVTGGKQFDDVLKSLALRLSDLSVRLIWWRWRNASAPGGCRRASWFASSRRVCAARAMP